MRTWLKPFLLTMAVLLGASALWVWAVPMTGNMGKNMQFTGTNEFDMGGILRANLFGMHQQSADPTTGADWQLYAKSTGVHVRDPSGNVTGPFGTGGGGGTATFAVARAATTATLTFPIVGTQTIDGVSVGSGSEIVLVKDQATGTQNGLYIAANPGTWTRSTSFDNSAEFTPGFPVYVQPGGTLNGNTLWNFSVVGAFTLGTTNVTFGRTGPGSLSELLSNKNAASGYAGLTSATKQIWTQRGDAATHAASPASGQITPTASTMRVSGSGGPVTLTTGNPRILGCATILDDGKELTIEGSDATNTLTMPTGNGVLLCGNTGAMTFGLNLGSAHFICNGANAIWRQSNCPDLQQVFNVSNKLQTGSTAATGFQWGDIPNQNYCTNFWDAANSNTPTTRCFVAGVVSDIVHALTATKKFLIKNAGGTTIFSVAEDGTITGANFGKAVLGNSDFGTPTCSAPGVSRFYSVLGSFGTATENEIQMPIPRAGTLANLYARTWAGVPSAQTAVLTLRKAGANTALTCSIAAAGTTCNDTTHSVTVVAGDLLSLALVCAGGTTSMSPVNFTMTLE